MESVGAALRFSVLGPLRAWRGNESLALGPPQQRAVLGVLLLRAGHVVTAEDLLTAVCGEDLPASGTKLIQTYVSGLRRVLEGAKPAERASVRLISYTGGGYILNTVPEQLDLTLFEQDLAAAEAARATGKPEEAAVLLRSALGRWSGEALAGLPGPYAEAQRSRLADVELAATELRVEIDLERGKHAEAAAELGVLIAQHPLRERLRGLLMLALYRSGRQAEALATYSDTRRALVDELGVDPSPELQELHRQILDADPGLAPPASPPTGTTPTPTPVVRPGQLPPDVADFTGREHIVDNMCRLLADEPGRAVVVSAVAGIGGVGKTTLAVHVGHRLRAQFPDGQLYVDLQGAGAQPAEPGQVLGRFLTALGVADADLPADTVDRSALYRSLVADRRMFILLDDARDTAQVSPLLPGSATCAVLVTSRARLAELPTHHRVDLEPLDPGEALAMFTRIVGERRIAAEPEAAASLVEACGYLPLAVRIAAARLASRPKWTIRNLLERLGVGPSRVAELRSGTLAVEATFDLSYQHLTEDAARAFRLLATFDGPEIDLHAAAAMLDLPASETEELLEHLVDVSLLDEPAAERYRFHDLLKLYGRRKSTAEDTDEARAEALSLIIDWYTAGARNAYRILAPGEPNPGWIRPTRSAGRSFDSTDQSSAWLEREASNLFAVLVQAIRSPVITTDHAVDLLLAVDVFVIRGTRWSEFRSCAGELARRAAREGRLRAEGFAAYLLGVAHLYARSTTAGIPHLERARDVLTEIGALPAAGCAHAGLGIAAYYRRDHPSAVTHHREALRIAEEISDRNLRATAIYNLVFPHLAQHQYDEAAGRAAEARTLARENGDDHQAAQACYALGKALRVLGRLDEAEESLLEALATFQSAGLTYRESFALAQLSCVVANTDPSRAMTLAEQALVIARREGYDDARAIALEGLGRALVALGETERARTCLRESVEVHEKVGSSDIDEVRASLESLDA